MFGVKPNPATATPAQLQGYERHKTRAAERQRKLSKNSREISGDFPEMTAADKRLRARVLKDFALFCRTIFPGVFYDPFCNDHHKVIAKMTRAAERGGLFALAMPRGSGKSALAIALCLWAVLKGLHEFVLLIGATKDGAVEILEGLRTQLETNDVLLRLFPEICYPIRRLEGISQRRLLWQGEPIRMKFTANRIVLPNLPPSKAASAIIGAAGITGRLRGMKFTRPDKREVRPSLVTIDDPQDDESAASPTQCAKRERIVSATILGLAGPGKKIAAVMPCTIIRHNDLAHRMLDRKTHPDWQGETMKMVYAFPKNEKRWSEYREIRERCLREDKPLDEANSYYRRHRKEMDEGAIVAWPERHEPDELSALQHAMNLKFRDEAAFLAEYQQEPVDLNAQEDAPKLTGIIEKVNRLARSILPIWTSKLVAFIDVQAKALWYKVGAFADDFTGAIVDYGTWPDQKRDLFTLADLTQTLEGALVGTGIEGGVEAAIWNGLEKLTDLLIGRAWKREDGSELWIERCLIDSGWGEYTDTVYEFCRRSKHAAIVMPSKGAGIRAGDRPMSEWPLKPHERPGFHTVLTSDPARRVVRLLRYDTNALKTFLAGRIATRGRGSLSLFGDDPVKHRLLANHYGAEYPIKTEGRGRTVWEWKQYPGQDNHWLDGGVGILAAASLQGCRLNENRPTAPPRKSSIPAHMIAGSAL